MTEEGPHSNSPSREETDPESPKGDTGSSGSPFVVKPGSPLASLREKYNQKSPLPEKQSWFVWYRRFRILCYVAVGLLVLYGIRPYKTYTIPSRVDNMTPQFPGGTTVLVHTQYRVADQGGGKRLIQRGDCILYRYRFKDQVVEMVGRVVGLPGEKILVREGKLYIDGKQADEAYLAQALVGAIRSSRADQVVPEGGVFVLNDDRASGILDSRDFGPLQPSQIEGKIVIGNHW